MGLIYIYIYTHYMYTYLHCGETPKTRERKKKKIIANTKTTVFAPATGSLNDYRVVARAAGKCNPSPMAFWGLRPATPSDTQHTRALE